MNGNIINPRSDLRLVTCHIFIEGDGMDIRDVMTTKELAEALNLNQAYVLRRAKKELEMNVDYRSTGKRSYIFAPSAYEKMKVKSVPKLVKAEMLPNFRLRLEFDNGENRYMTTQLQKDFVSQYKKTLKWVVGFTLIPSTSWMRDDMMIDEEGALRIGNQVYTSQELYEQSHHHIL